MSDSLEASMMKRIGELKAENARLKADVNELADGLKLASEVGIKMADEVNRLKAECQARQAENSVLAVECDSLKAEVERLTSENKSLQAKATNIYNAMVVGCKVEEITHKANADSIISQGMMSEAMKMMEESVAIREQVERLTKAGDAMHSFVIGYIVENRLSSSYLSKLDDGWQNAKGVQS